MFGLVSIRTCPSGRSNQAAPPLPRRYAHHVYFISGYLPSAYSRPPRPSTRDPVLSPYPPSHPYKLLPSFLSLLSLCTCLQPAGLPRPAQLGKQEENYFPRGPHHVPHQSLTLRCSDHIQDDTRPDTSPPNTPRSSSATLTRNVQYAPSPSSFLIVRS